MHGPPQGRPTSLFLPESVTSILKTRHGPLLLPVLRNLKNFPFITIIACVASLQILSGSWPITGVRWAMSS
jgi:hypothetical protein